MILERGYAELIFKTQSLDVDLNIHIERQTLKLFPEKTWIKIFIETGFSMNQSTLNDIYEKNIIGVGEYPLTVFIGRKKKK